MQTHAQPGEHIRVTKWSWATNSQGKQYKKYSIMHSLVFLAFGSEGGKDGFYTADYWGGAKKNENGVYKYNAGNDQYRIKFWSFADFQKKYAGANCVISNCYETSEFASMTPGTPGTPASQKTRDIVLVLDSSGSMSGSRIQNTRTAAKKFVESLLGESSTTRIAVVTYASSVRTISELSNDIEALKTAIDGIGATGITNMYSGMDMADQILQNSTADKKAIVVMTDGEANSGTRGTASTRIIAEGDEIYFSNYNVALYDLAQDFVNNKGYTIYSFGFGLSNGSNAYKMMNYIASISPTGERYFWANPDVDSIVFTFDDIQSTITKKKSIVITIECPVLASVTLDGETLDKDNLTASFGKLNYTALGENDNKYVFTLNDSPDYDIQIRGIGEGVMNFTITYYEGDDSTFRKFVSVPITGSTTVTTSATDRRADFALYVDAGNDGQIEEGWVAGVDETVYAPDDEILQELYPTTDDFEELPEQEETDTRTWTYFNNGDTHTKTCAETGETVIEPHTFVNEICVCGAHSYLNRAFVDPLKWPTTPTFTPSEWWSAPTAPTEPTEPTVQPTDPTEPAELPTTPTEAPTQPVNPFADVKESDWYYDAVLDVYAKGLMNGTSATTFEPDLGLSRGMIVTILHRLEGTPAAGACPFGDVKPGSYYEAAITWAAENGIVNGYDESRFGPDDPVTREQMAAILYRYAQTKGEGFTGAWYFPLSFDDAASVSSWADEAMHWCVMNGMIGAVDSGKLEPASIASRAQVAMCLNQYCIAFVD